MHKIKLLCQKPNMIFYIYLYYWRRNTDCTENRVAHLCEVSPTLSSIVSHSLSINLKPWKKKNHSFLFSFCLLPKSSPSKSYPFKSSPESVRLQNPEMHGHLWNADVYNLKSSCPPCTWLFVVACFLKLLLLSLELCSYLDSVIALVRFECVYVWGAFTPHRESCWQCDSCCVCVCVSCCSLMVFL